MPVYPTVGLGLPRLDLEVYPGIELPYVFTFDGVDVPAVPTLTIGEYTYEGTVVGYEVTFDVGSTVGTVGQEVVLYDGATALAAGKVVRWTGPAGTVPGAILVRPADSSTVVMKPVPGPAATIAVGDVEQGEIGEPLSFTNVGTPNAAIFDVRIPPALDMGATPIDVPGGVTSFTKARELTHDIRKWTDGAASVAAGFQAAVDDLSSRAFPGGTLVIPENVSLGVNSPILMRGAPLTVEGEGPSSEITTTRASNDMAGIFVQRLVSGTPDPLPAFTVRNLRMVGGMVDPGQGCGPLRGRTRGHWSATHAIYFEGWRTGFETLPEIYDVTIEGCQFVDYASCPFFISGVKERISVTGNLFRNTMDPGFVGCDEVIFSDNMTERGADNGVSVSRGCRRITVSGNVFVEVAHTGIWVAGFDGEEGPHFFSVTGNTVERCGHHGIRVVDGVHTGTITGNTVSGAQRGPSDVPTDSAGTGLRLGNQIAATVTGVAATGNTFRDCARGGVLVDTGVADSLIASNLIINPGTATTAGGVAIPSSSTSENFGVAVVASVSRVDVRGNTVIDDRVTKLANYPISGTHLTTGAVHGNTAYGTRRPLTETTPEAGIRLGTAGWVSAPSHPRLDITGDLSVVVDVSMPDWTPAAAGTIIGRYLTTGNKRGWNLQVTTGGFLSLTWSTDGTATSFIATDAGLGGLADGTRRLIWFEFDVDNGAAGRALKVYTSTDGVTWTQLGTTTTQAGTTSIFGGGLTGGALEIGSHSAGASALLGGTVYSASVRSGISGTTTPGGTEVAYWEPTTANRNKDRYGNVWTTRGTTWTYANPTAAT